jgi:putative serine protease PepD
VTSGRGNAATSRRPGARIVIPIVIVGIAVALVAGWLSFHNNGLAASSSGDLGACDAAAIARDVLPSIVTVETSTSAGAGNGSGQVVRTDGYVLTNYHVVGSAAAAGATGGVAVRYTDGSRSPATIVGIDPTTDLAVIKADDRAANRPVIRIGSSGDLVVGQPVVALGAPLGLTSTVTHGIVSALDRYLPLDVGGGQTAHLVDAVQTDASINPGNSGGALVDCAGRLVGVNSAIITAPNSAGQAGGGSIGLGFAIPVDLAEPLAEQLITTGQANHPTFGLQAVPIVGPSGGSTALFVTVVDPGGPAEQAGIQVGDKLTVVDGRPARNVSQLEKIALLRNAGDSVPVTIVRNGAPTETAIVLGSPAAGR